MSEMSFEEMERDEERLTQAFYKLHGRYPSYYEAFGHPNWVKQLQEHSEDKDD